MKKIIVVFAVLLFWSNEARAQSFGAASKITTYLDTCGTGTWDVHTINSASNKSFRIQVLNDGIQAIYVVFGTDTTTTSAKASSDSTTVLTVLGEYVKPGERVWFGDEGVMLAVIRIKAAASGTIPYRLRKVE